MKGVEWYLDSDGLHIRNTNGRTVGVDFCSGMLLKMYPGDVRIVQNGNDVCDVVAINE
ncbi:MAG: hypothetical protein LBQ34_02100 [Alphaproteobacteria bacterium]|jgi:hypothetical protein|nr:hypothetical protein [Alphaproteobacteria bacterium]